MANVQLKSSIYFDGQGISIVKTSTGLSPNINEQTPPQPVIPVTGNAAQFEMLITPIGGNTETITRNDASSWTPLNGVKYAEHTLTVADTAAAGVYSNQVSYTVHVRKISNPVDGVAGTITAANNLTVSRGTVTPPEPGDTPSTPIELTAVYIGADQNTGTAEVLMYYNGRNLKTNERYRGTDTGGVWMDDIQLREWITAAAYTGNVADYAIKTTYIDGDQLTVRNFNSTTSMQTGERLIGSNVTVGPTDYRATTILISIYRIGQSTPVYEKYYKFIVNVVN